MGTKNQEPRFPRTIACVLGSTMSLEDFEYICINLSESGLIRINPDQSTAGTKNQDFPELLRAFLVLGSWFWVPKSFKTFKTVLKLLTHIYIYGTPLHIWHQNMKNQDFPELLRAFLVLGSWFWVPKSFKTCKTFLKLFDPYLYIPPCTSDTKTWKHPCTSEHENMSLPPCL